jgi:hypothetical protein
VTRRSYLYTLAAEVCTGRRDESYSNGHMERGKALEEEARLLYAFQKDCDPERVGFLRNDYPAGASPDAFVGDGGLEIKCAIGKVQVERLMQGTLPPEHIPQVQGCMWVSERPWWDFVSYSPGLPLLVVRVRRDDAYIAALASAVAQFNEDLARVVEFIRSHGRPTTTLEQFRKSAEVA